MTISLILTTIRYYPSRQSAKMLMRRAMPACRNPSGLGLWIVGSPSEKEELGRPLDPHLISSHPCQPFVCKLALVANSLDLGGGGGVLE